MSTENLDGIYSYPAAADLSGSQYCAMTINSSGQAAVAAANSALVDGILHNNTADAANKMARLITLSGVVVKAKLGATVAIGALLTTDASGRLVTATSGQNVVAKAHRFGGVVNEIVEVLWWGKRGTAA